MIKLITGSFMFVAGLLFMATGVGIVVGLPMFIGGLAMGVSGFFSLGKTAVQAGSAIGKIGREYSTSRETASYPETLAVAATPSRSVADEISKLAELLKQGMITQDEFDAQKAQILRS
ncbi:hypothetical protein ASD54_25295 [Rhizobium sp. Root149]|uniref:SHOCT domain-containing protein n=1 Tax=Rhizobium sp. Root149 TaxID=1736473 RepID=UPI000713C667|nr:SHOCT domain-containing protein [Rhizobium sp. Root149]KQZ56260.1 hypothetical protein ASD54_25295 [Rhizobium sp. Root149]